MLSESQKSEMLMDVMRANPRPTASDILMLALLGEIHSELVLIRKATEQANEEDEPGATRLGDMSFPFAAGETLNGP